MLSTSLTTSSTASVYYDALDTLPQVEIKESFFTRVKNKIFATANFNFSYLPTKIRDRLVNGKRQYY